MLTGGNARFTDGGTWKVNVTAGAAPRKNDSIDVYISISDSTECHSGDSFECYSGDMSTGNLAERKVVNGQYKDPISELWVHFPFINNFELNQIDL